MTAVVEQQVLQRYIQKLPIETCGAEVQKGKAPTERKIQRLFRREEVSKIIKKCNDFGAGGCILAIGELVMVWLLIWIRFQEVRTGLDGTELAISESSGENGSCS